MALITVITVILATEIFEGDIQGTQDAERRMISERTGEDPA